MNDSSDTADDELALLPDFVKKHSDHASANLGISEREQEEKVLRQSEALYKAFFNQSPLGITVEDYSGTKRAIDDLKSKGIKDFKAYFRANQDVFSVVAKGIRLIDANDTQIEMFETNSFEEYKTYEETNDLSTEVAWYDFYLDEISAFANGQTTHIGEVSDLRADGSKIEVRCVSRIIGETGNDWSTVVSVHEDNTERKQAVEKLRESEQRFRTLYQQSPSGVSLEDYSQVKRRIDQLARQGVKDFRAYFQEHDDELLDLVMDIRLLDANQSLIEMVGCSSFEEFKKYDGDFEFWKDSGWRDFYIGEFVALAAGKLTHTGVYEDTMITGTPILIQCSSRVVSGHEDNWSEIITTHEDITELKNIERRLREATEIAKEANRAKSEFLANMSHELRTPLNAVIGFSQALQTEVFGSVGSASNKEYVNIINGSGSHLLRIIGDILDLSKIEAGEDAIEEETIDVGEIMDECRQMMSERASKKRLSFLVETQNKISSLLADRLKVKQILLNLLSNAIKFTPEGGTVKIDVSRIDDNSMLFSVRDTGIGIAPKDIETVIEPFAQVGTANTRSHEGTGLGLALVKSLTELHGGTLTLQSELGVGTVVRIRFPSERTIST